MLVSTDGRWNHRPWRHVSTTQVPLQEVTQQRDLTAQRVRVDVQMTCLGLPYSTLSTLISKALYCPYLFALETKNIGAVQHFEHTDLQSAGLSRFFLIWKHEK